MRSQVKDRRQEHLGKLLIFKMKAPEPGRRWNAACRQCARRGGRTLLGWVTWPPDREPHFAKLTVTGSSRYGVSRNREMTEVRCPNCKRETPVVAEDLRNAVRAHVRGWDEDLLI